MIETMQEQVDEADFNGTDLGIPAQTIKQARGTERWGNGGAGKGENEEISELPLVLSGGVPSTDVQRIVDKARAIAQSLNHKELKVAHVLLAASLDVEGKRRLIERNIDGSHIDERRVRSLCWKQLADYGPLPTTPASIVASEEVRTSFQVAQQIAAREHDPGLASTVQVGTMIRALVEGPYGERFAALYRSENRFPSQEETAKNVYDIKWVVDTSLPLITANLDEHKRALDNSARTTEAIDVTVAAVKVGIADVQTTAQLIQKELAAQREANAAAQLRTEKRVKNVKHIAIGTLAVALLALAVGLWIGLPKPLP